MNKCKECGSYAINVGNGGRDQSDPDLCDVCYWRKRWLERGAEIERLRCDRDEAREIAINLHRFLSYHEATPDIDESYAWLHEAAEKARTA